MSILLDMEEENGFEAGPVKVRLHNLLCTRTCQINLKSRKVRLEKEIFEIEATNCGLEQRLKVLDMCVMGMEEKKYQEMKASLGMQKTENCSSISKLQVDLCQVEESLKGQSTAQIRQEMESRISNRSKAVLDSEFRMLLLVVIHADPMTKPKKCFPVRPKGSCQIQSMDDPKAAVQILSRVNEPDTKYQRAEPASAFYLINAPLPEVGVCCTY